MKSSAVYATLGLFLLALVLTPTAWAQTSEQELRQEIEALKKGQEAIQKDLQEIKTLLQQRPAARPAPQGPDVAGKVFDLGGNPAVGPSSAKITLVEFTDYQ